MGKARAEIEITASDSKLAAGLARAYGKVSAWAAHVARGTNSIGGPPAKLQKNGASFNKSTGHMLSTFGGNVLTQGFDGAIGALANAGKGVIDFERKLVRYQIVADKSTAQMGEFRSAVRQVSRDTGISSDAVLAGAQAYLDLTGDVEGAAKQMSTFARVAQASDSSMSDVSTLAAALQDSMHVDPSQMEAVMSGLINQGKAGAVTMKDMAGEFTGLLPRFARFGELGASGTNILGAMFQVGRKGFKSAEETGTGMAAMLGGLIKHADRFKKAGVNVFDVGKDGTKTLRPISKIIEEIGTSKLAKDPQLLNKAFGRGEGEQIYQMLSGHVDMLKQMETAGQDAGTVQRDLATFMTSSAGRIDLTFNKMKETVADLFTPARIEKFASIMEGMGGVVVKIVEGLDAVASWIEEHNKSDDTKQTDMMDARGGRKASAQGMEDQANLLDRDADKRKAELDDDWMVMDSTRDEYRNKHKAAAQLRVMAKKKRGEEKMTAEDYQLTAMSKGPEMFTQAAAPGSFAQAMGKQTPHEAEVLAVLREIADRVGEAKTPVVKLGDNQVSKSADKATHKRMKP